MAPTQKIVKAKTNTKKCHSTITPESSQKHPKKDAITSLNNVVEMDYNSTKLYLES